MRAYIGIDPGIQPTLAIVRGDKIEFVQIENPYPAQMEEVWPKWRVEHLRIQQVRTYLIIALSRIPGDRIVGVESMAFGKPFRAAMMGKIEHEIQYAYHNTERMYMIAPSTWKKNIIGHGRASKEETEAFLKDKFPELKRKRGLTHNHWDALAIALEAKRRFENDRQVANQKTRKPRSYKVRKKVRNKPH